MSVASSRSAVLVSAISLLVACQTGPATVPSAPQSPEVERLCEIALGSEYGGAGSRIRMWTRDLRIQVHGTPTATDRETLNRVVAELDELTASVQLRIVDEDPNVDLHFAPLDSFSTIESNWVPGNLGFFWVRWDSGGAIYRARILLASDRLTQRERSHMLREELTQSLGLMQDSGRDPESIFYSGRSVTDRYADLDRAIVRLLYGGAVAPDMTRDEVRAALAGAHPKG